MKIDTVSRFSSKAEKYAKYRPDYSAEAIRAIFENAKLTSESVVADIGSGTGIVSQHFIKNGNLVYAVEPNLQMSQIAQSQLGKYRNFHQVQGYAEATTLPDASVDLIAVGQAKHWFESEPTKREFVRILKPTGWLAILYNTRSTDNLDSEIRRACITENGWDTDPAHAKRPQGRPVEWYYEGNELIKLNFSNPRTYDLEGFIGLELSNSYAPDESHHAFPAFVDALARVFEKFQAQGKVTINFITDLYLGKVEGISHSQPPNASSDRKP